MASASWLVTATRERLTSALISGVHRVAMGSPAWAWRRQERGGTSLTNQTGQGARWVSRLDAHGLAYGLRQTGHAMNLFNPVAPGSRQPCTAAHGQALQGVVQAPTVDPLTRALLPCTDLPS